MVRAPSFPGPDGRSFVPRIQAHPDRSAAANCDIGLPVRRGPPARGREIRHTTGAFVPHKWRFYEPEINDGVRVWAAAAALMLAAIVALFALIYLFNPTSPVNRWLQQTLSARIEFWGVAVPLAWLETVPQWLALLGLLAACLFILDFLDFTSATDVRSLSGVVGGLVAYSIVIVLLTLGAE